LKIFIGSSTESISHAQGVAELLRNSGYEPLLWTEPGLFHVGKTHVEDLESNAGRVDAAVFVFSEDDERIIRGKKVPAVRANVLFEYGLFTGKLGRERTCIVLIGNPDIASDFSGIKHVVLNRENAADELSQWLKSKGPRPPLLPQIDLRENIGISLGELILKKAQSSLFISGVSNVSLSGFKSDLLRRSADLSIRLLLTDLRDRSLQKYYKNLRSKSRYEDDTTGFMELLATAESGNPIQIRMADFIMPAFFAAADMDLPSGVITAFHTFYDTSSSQRPSVMLTKEHGIWFERYRAQIEHIWENAKPFTNIT